MFVLEYAELYIVKEPLRKNRCHQTTRWKQLYACEDREPLQAILDEKNDAYRRLSKVLHPDSGGTAEQFRALTEARDQALEYFKEVAE